MLEQGAMQERRKAKPITPEKPKREATSKPNAVRFVAPFGLNECRSRLLSRTEPTAVFAWKFQTRLVAEVWPLDRDMLSFVLYRAPKSSLQWDVFSKVTRVRGVLGRQSDRETEVLFVVETTIVGYVLYTLTLLLFWVAFTGMLIEGFALGWQPAVIAGAVVLALLMIVYVFYVEFEHGRLRKVVEQTLGADRLAPVEKPKR
jgi:hypothetical protein